jgi:hypothetical protein
MHFSIAKGEGGTVPLDRSGNVKGYAAGTADSPKGPAIVGERGPEIVELPQGAKVKTAEETKGWFQSAWEGIKGAYVGTPEQQKETLKRTQEFEQNGPAVDAMGAVAAPPKAVGDYGGFSTAKIEPKAPAKPAPKPKPKPKPKTKPQPYVDPYAQSKAMFQQAQQDDSPAAFARASQQRLKEEAAVQNQKHSTKLLGHVAGRQ